MAAGKPQAQSVAIAYSQARKDKAASKPKNLIANQGILVYY